MSAQLQHTQSWTTAPAPTPDAGPRKHREYCFAGQPAPCQGYFAGDVLPCVCGVDGTVVQALSRVAIPVVAPVEDEPAQSHAMPLSA
jgi:hypothetical protein